MAFSSGSTRRIGYVNEVTFGTTPNTPTIKVMRVTGGGGRFNKVTGTSDEIRADRNVSDEFMLGKDGTASYDFELSYGSIDDILENALFSNFTTDILKNGVIAKSMSIEETREGGVTDYFSLYKGSRVNTLSLNFAARQAVTGSVGFLFKEEVISTVAAGTVYTAVNSNPILTASSHVTDLTIAGAGTPKVRSISMEINNNLRTRPVIAAVLSEEFGEGKFDVTGTAEAYFENHTWYQTMLDHGNSNVSITVGAASGSKYTFRVPKAIWGTGEIVGGGNNDDIIVRMPFRGVYDSGQSCTLKVERAVV